MYPHEPLMIADCRLLIYCRLRGLRIEDPFSGRRQDSVGGALHDLEVGARALDAVVVEVEAGVQAEARVEDEGADKRRRPVAGALQLAGERRLRAVVAERSV